MERPSDLIAYTELKKGGCVASENQRSQASWNLFLIIQLGGMGEEMLIMQLPKVIL